MSMHMYDEGTGKMVQVSGGYDGDGLQGEMVAIMPDSAKMETINRIPALDGSWVVDRLGYVYCQFHSSAVAGQFPMGEYVVTINGKQMQRHVMAGMTGHAQGTSDTFLVSQGDIVKMTASLTPSHESVTATECYFVPPKIVRVSGDADELLGNTFFITPDSKNMESINRITSNNGTWEVDRDGYVYAYGSATFGSGSSGGRLMVYVNDHPRGAISLALSGMTYGNTFSVITGDVVKMVIDSGTPNAFRCSFVPPKIVWATSPATKFNVNLIGPPDYQNIETTNRITENGGSWTADRDGHVALARGKTGGGYDSGSAWFSIDGVDVSGSTPYGLYTVEPISKGQTVLFTSNVAVSNVICRFIPPKSVAPMFITGADMQSSTDNGKVSIDPATKTMSVNDNYTIAEQDTGKKWIDGKAIYRGVIQDTLPNVTSVSENIGKTIPISMQDLLVCNLTAIRLDNPSYEAKINGGGILAINQTNLCILEIQKTSVGLMLAMICQSQVLIDRWSNAPFTAIVEYTKLT